MDSFIGFITLSIAAVLLYRSAAWVRRAKAGHRERFRQMGYLENNRPRRLRREKYVRVWLVAYMAFGLIQIWNIPGIRSPYYGYHHSPFLHFWEFMVISFTSIPLATAVYWATVWIAETKSPIGDVALNIRDKEMHRAFGPLQPRGEKGTGKEITPEEAGLMVAQLNLQGRQIKGFVPIVPESEEKK